MDEKSKPEVYLIAFNSKGAEAKLKEIKTKGCKLYISRSIHDKPETIYDFTILNKYLDEISPIKITFSSIGFNCNLGSRFDNVRKLTAKIVNIATVSFKYCSITLPFYQHFFVDLNLLGSRSKITKVKFRGCRVTPECKTAIMSGLGCNYSIRSLVIHDIDSSSVFDPDYVAIDGGIKSYLYRNRARHLCRMAALTLILIRRHRKSLFSCFDKSLVVHLAKMVYDTRTGAEWLGVIFDDELKNMGKNI